MLLSEAKAILKKSGYSLVEGSMPLKNKIANAKNFNRGIAEMNNEPKRLSEVVPWAKRLGFKSYRDLSLMDDTPYIHIESSNNPDEYIDIFYLGVDYKYRIDGPNDKTIGFFNTFKECFDAVKEILFD